MFVVFKFLTIKPRAMQCLKSFPGDRHLTYTQPWNILKKENKKEERKSLSLIAIIQHEEFNSESYFPHESSCLLQCEQCHRLLLHFLKLLLELPNATDPLFP